MCVGVYVCVCMSVGVCVCVGVDVWMGGRHVIICVYVCVCCAHMIIPDGSLIPGGSPGTPPALP